MVWERIRIQFADDRLFKLLTTFCLVALNLDNAIKRD